MSFVQEVLQYYPPNQVLVSDDGETALIVHFGGDRIIYTLIGHGPARRIKFFPDADVNDMKSMISAWLEELDIDINTLRPPK